jgi:TonB family protein
MITLFIEAALRSCALAVAVGLVMVIVRLRNAHLERNVWSAILLAAFAMPWLMRLELLPTATAPPISLPHQVAVISEPLAATSRFGELGIICLYASVAVALFVRQSIGLVRSWRLRRNASPLQQSLDAAADIRVSNELQSPANVFSTVIVPAAFHEWTLEQRRAVIAHEQAHVRNRDFYMQQLAQLHRSVFWFSPLAWWLPRRLAILNEHISDDAALSVMPERAAYAELLLGFARSTIRDEHAVAMARPATLVARVDRILGQQALSRRPGRLTKFATLAALLPFVGIASGLQATPATSTSSSAAQTQPPAGSIGAASSQSKVVLPKANPKMPLSIPVYPPMSRRLLEQGTVVLKLHVTAKGLVSDAVIEKSSGFIDLDNAARYESFRWRPDPGTIDGTPVAMWGEFAVTFKLSDGS